MSMTRTDEKKLVHFAKAAGWTRKRDTAFHCYVWHDSSGPIAYDLFDFALDEAQMGRVVSALERVAPEWSSKRWWGYYGLSQGMVIAPRSKSFQSAAFALVLAVTGYGDE